MVHEQTMSNNMNICQTIFLMVLFSFADSTRTESIRRSPTNATQKLGESATFACEVQFGTIITMTWEFNNEIIYSHLVGMDHYPMGNTKYTVTRTGRLFNLVVKDLRYADGGEYTCLVTTVSAKAVLIVLGAPSIFSEPLNPVEGDTAVYTCIAQFGGPGKNYVSPDHFPKLRMFFHGSDRRFLNATRPTTQETPHHLIKAYNFTLEASMHDRQLICEIRTVHPVMNLTTSTSIVVEYPVRNISYEPVQKNYEVGMGITCIADSNPPAFFEWRKEATKEHPIKGNWLNITMDMIGKNLWWCTARNVVGKNIYDDSILASFNAVSDMKHPESHESTNGALHIPVIIILTLVNMTTGVACLACYLKRSGMRREVNVQYSVLPLHLSNDHLSSKLSENSKIVKEALQSKESLDEKRSLVMDAIKNNCGELIVCHPEIFLEAIRKANTLIESYYYVVILKDMADIYKGVLDKPLQCLIQVICDEKEPVVLFNHQESMHKLVEIIIHVGNHDDLKSNLLLHLITKSEYISKSKNALKWTTQLLSTLNLLLEKGADPMWRKDDWENLARQNRYTAQYRFLWVISRILLSNNHCLDAIKKVLPRFMSHKSPEATEEALGPRGTALHALLEFDWELLNKQSKCLQNRFCQQYEQILKEVIKTDHILENANWQGRTPLQLFLDEIKFHEDILQNVIDIVSILKSKNYKNKTDEKGYNVFHFVAVSYPLFVEVPSEARQKSFFEFLRDLKSGSEVQDRNSQTPLDVWDKNGQTPLHIIAKTSMNSTEHYKEFLTEFVHIFATQSNTDIQDNEGKLALHILAETFTWYVPKDNLEMFQGLVEQISFPFNSSTRDHKGRTVLHTLVGQYSICMSQQHLKILQKLVGMYKTESNAQDKHGQIALHILAEKFAWDMPEDNLEIFHDIMQILSSPSNNSSRDHKGCTVLHILVGQYSKWMSLQHLKILQKFVGMYTTESNAQDKHGQIALHILAEKFAWDMPEDNLEIFHDIMQILSSPSNNSSRDHKGCTVLHILVGQYSKWMSLQHLKILQKLVGMYKTESNAQDKAGHTALHILAESFPLDVRDGNPEVYQNIFEKLVGNLKAAANIQDSEGQTALHILARQIYEDPKMGNNNLSIFMMLATDQNVNVQDSQSLTPYYWVLQGKLKTHKHKSGDIYYKLEDILLLKGAERAKSGYNDTQSYQESINTGYSSLFWKRCMRLYEQIDIPQRHIYIQAYEKDLRHYIVVDEEFLRNLEKNDVITSEERHLIEGSPEKSEDKQILDMLEMLWRMENNMKYLAFLEVMAQEHEDLTNLLTGGKWRGVDNEARFG